MDPVIPVVEGFEKDQIVLKAEGCIDLPVLQTEKYLISRWRPSDEERKLIAEGGDVYLWVWSNRHPPVSICGEPVLVREVTMTKLVVALPDIKIKTAEPPETGAEGPRTGVEGPESEVGQSETEVTEFGTETGRLDKPEPERSPLH